MLARLPTCTGHLLIPLIDFLASKGMHTKDELEKSKLTILFKTNMIDLAMDICKDSGKPVPAAMSSRREEVVSTMKSLREEVAPILEIVIDPGRVAELLREYVSLYEAN